LALETSFGLAFGQNGSVHPLMSSFSPIPELRRPDADVFLFFLNAAGVIFSQPVLDPWYKATTPYQQQLHQASVFTGNTSIYMQDEPGSPLSCAEQHQLCASGAFEGKECTPLMSFSDLFDIRHVSGLTSNENKKHRMEWTLNTTLSKMLQSFHPVAVLGIQSLTARTSINGGHQAPLPSNQWQLEIQHWHASVMAHLQRQFLEAATGPRDPKLESIFRFAETPEERDLCSNQVRTTPLIIILAKASH